MRRPGIETNVTILAIFIVLAVAVSGFLIYRSLTEIVGSIHNEVDSDYRLIVIKDISLDLMEVENHIQLYTITKNKSNLKDYREVSKRLMDRTNVLLGLSSPQNETSYLNDSVKYYVEEKLDIWKQIRQLNVIEDDPTPQFDTLYSMLEKKEIDTVQVEVLVEPPKKKGLLNRIFGKKDSVESRIDTTFIETTVENEEIKEEIEQLQTDLLEREEKKNRRELFLINKNIEITGKLNNLISRIEQAERDFLIQKNEEADQLSALIYKRLSIFSIAIVALLFVVLLLFISYLRKARKYQRVLKSAKQDTERLAKAKEVFMANVSHEMRTPVNAIYGLAEQLLQQNTSPDINEKVSVLLKSSKHLKEVVNDMLDFSKIQANKLKLKNVDFSLESVINEVLELHKPDAIKKNIELTYRSSGELPLALLGDPIRLKQILINIIGNAIKFTERGNIVLQVNPKKITSFLVHIHFEINDTGIGIPKENLEHIFEDFIQVETDYTRKFSGTGLGLSIVKKLVELQKGKIKIESEINNGTVVSFHIPYRLGNADNIKQVKKQALNVPESVKKLKVLVVDDEEFNRFLLKVIFEKWGVDFLEAKNGNEAVKLALENNFDLILMDLRMPDLNGIDASRQIMKEKPDTKIIAVAAISGESELKICKEAGMQNFLSKPFAEKDLLDAIVSVLDIDVEKNNSSEEYGLEELERLSNGDEGFMKEMIQIFIRSSQTGIKNIKFAFKERNWNEVSEAAHKMAAPCKHLMANDLYNNLKVLEKNNGHAMSLKSTQKLIDLVEKKVIQINKSLTNLIESDKFDSHTN